MMEIFKNVCVAWGWYFNHPRLIVEGRQPSIDIMPMLVDPEEGVVSDDRSRNTKVVWAVEGGV